jgi:hypothetical protein
MMPSATVEDMNKPGDRTLSIWKGNGYYHFTTYSCHDTENDCDKNVWYNLPYGEFLQSWTYLYMGYSLDL